MSDHAETIGDGPFKQGGTYAWVVVFILCLASVVGFVDRQVINLMVDPIRADLGINDVQIGLLQGFSFVLLYAFLAIPVAWLADSGKRTRVITLGILCWSLATFFCGLATTFVLMFIARIFVGMGEVTLAPSGYSLIGDYFPKEKVSLAISLFTGSGFLGSGLAYIIGGAVVGALSGSDTYALPIVGEVKPWQLTFMVVAIPGLLLVLVMQLVKEPPRQSTVVGRSVEEKVAMSRSFKALVKYISANRRLFGCIFMGFAITAAATFAVVNWTPAFLTRTFGWSPADAGTRFGPILMISSTAGVFFGGFIASTLMKRGIVHANLSVSIVAGLSAAIFAMLFPLSDTADAALMLLTPALFFGAMPFGCGTATLPIISPNRLRAQVVAVYLLIANLLGLTLGPTGVGFITEYVFEDPLRIGDAMAIATPLFYVLGALLVVFALKPYTNIVANQDTNDGVA